MDALTAVGLTYRYPSADSDAVSGVDLTLERGRRLAVVGANGSGKSTLLLLLKGLLAPTQGSVRIDGREPRDGDPPAHLAVGYVFQNPDNQIVATIVDEDVAFGPENLDVSGPQLAGRVTEALDAVGIAHLAEREPHTLSGGEKQRLAIAGALALWPCYLLLDEATSMLDPEGREDFRGVVSGLAASGRIGMIEVTHDLAEAVDADEVLLLDGGRIVKHGAPRDVLGDAAALQAAGLAPMFVTSLATALRSEGVGVPGDLLTVEEVLAAL